MFANYSARSARWRTYADVDRSFSSADAVAEATPRTIALRFYARGMAVNLYRITSRVPIIECGMWIESLAPVELRRVPDPFWSY